MRDTPHPITGEIMEEEMEKVGELYLEYCVYELDLSLEDGMVHWNMVWFGTILYKLCWCKDENIMEWYQRGWSECVYGLKGMKRVQLLEYYEDDAGNKSTNYWIFARILNQLTTDFVDICDVLCVFDDVTFVWTELILIWFWWIGL